MGPRVITFPVIALPPRFKSMYIVNLPANIDRPVNSRLRHHVRIKETWRGRESPTPPQRRPSPRGPAPSAPRLRAPRFRAPRLRAPRLRAPRPVPALPAPGPPREQRGISLQRHGRSLIVCHHFPIRGNMAHDEHPARLGPRKRACFGLIVSATPAIAPLRHAPNPAIRAAEAAAATLRIGTVC